MSGQELIERLAQECGRRKMPPYDGTMMNILREVLDLEAYMRKPRETEPKDNE